MLISTPVYSMSGTRYFDINPTGGGEPYRLFFFIPAGTPPAEGWPLLVMTDGNATFPLAVASLVTQAPYPTATGIGWGVIAAIGYPGDEPYNGMRRSWNLTPPPGSSYPPYSEGGPAILTGGADDFLTDLDNDLLPRIMETVAVDATRGTLFGHSFGGLFTLYALFHHPDLFANWVAASPSIYWEDGVILKSEATRRLASGAATFLHLSAGEFEGDKLAPFQNRNEDAAERLENKKLERTVSLAQEMAARLDGAADGLRTSFELFPGETHMSVLPSVVNRAVGIAFAIRN